MCSALNPPARRIRIRASGPALITTTAILVVAFLTDLYSDLAVLSSFGLPLSRALFSALVADLFLLPVLILTFQPFGPGKATTPTTA